MYTVTFYNYLGMLNFISSKANSFFFYNKYICLQWRKELQLDLEKEEKGRQKEIEINQKEEEDRQKELEERRAQKLQKILGQSFYNIQIEKKKCCRLFRAMKILVKIKSKE